MSTMQNMKASLAKCYEESKEQKLLLPDGAAKNANEINEIFMAIYNNNIEKLSKLIKLHGTEALNFFEETPLIYATMIEKSQAIDILLNNNANMYSKNYLGETAFHLASKKGLIDIVKIFCNHNINLDIRSQEGFTALCYAAFFKKYEVAEYLIKKGASLFIPEEVTNKNAYDLITTGSNSNLINMIKNSL